MKLSIASKVFIKYGFIFLLIIGCFWQILTISEFYFNYPTNVFIETKFDAIEKPLPAISFCTLLSCNHTFNESSDVLKAYKVEELMNSTINSMRGAILLDNSAYFWETAVEMASNQFYCFTLNSLRKGEFKEFFSFCQGYNFSIL